METVTYHTLALGFIAMSLRASKETDRANTRTVIDTGTLTIGTYIIQGIIGLLVTIPMYLWWRNPEAGRDIFYSGGLLVYVHARHNLSTSVLQNIGQFYSLLLW